MSSTADKIAEFLAGEADYDQRALLREARDELTKSQTADFHKAAAPAVVVDDLHEVFQLCHHPAYPDPLRLLAGTLDGALREIAPHYRDGIVLLRTVTGGRTAYTGEQLRQMAVAALGQEVGR